MVISPGMGPSRAQATLLSESRDTSQKEYQGSFWAPLHAVPGSAYIANLFGMRSPAIPGIIVTYPALFQ